MLSFDRIIAVMLILLLIVAFVLVSILNASTSQVESFSEARSLCGSIGKSSCEPTGELPMSWKINRIKVGDSNSTCYEITGCNSCESCGYVQRS